MVSVPSGRRPGVLFAPESIVAAPAVITNLIVGAAVEARSPTSADMRQAANRQPLGGRAKRLFDVVVSASMLTVLAPLMLVVAGLTRLLIGPAIVAQQRVGFGGRSFTCYTFRTDQRVGCLSNVLHQSGLDELPQLINVLKGDMSLVGPQPVTADELANYGRHARHYSVARPGIVGLGRSAGASPVSYRARAMRDRLYASKWSLGLDVALLWKSVFAPLNLKQTP